MTAQEDHPSKDQPESTPEQKRFEELLAGHKCPADMDVTRDNTPQDPRTLSGELAEFESRFQETKQAPVPQGAVSDELAVFENMIADVPIHHNAQQMDGAHEDPTHAPGREVQLFQQLMESSATASMTKHTPVSVPEAQAASCAETNIQDATPLPESSDAAIQISGEEDKPTEAMDSETQTLSGRETPAAEIAEEDGFIKALLNNADALEAELSDQETVAAEPTPPGPAPSTAPQAQKDDPLISDLERELEAMLQEAGDDTRGAGDSGSHPSGPLRRTAAAASVHAGTDGPAAAESAQADEARGWRYFLKKTEFVKQILAAMLAFPMMILILGPVKILERKVLHRLVHKEPLRNNVKDISGLVGGVMLFTSLIWILMMLFYY